MGEHLTLVERVGPQRFIGSCSCGWEGRQRVGTEFWNKAAALNACLGHQRDEGASLSLPSYVDRDPTTARGR